MTFDIAGLWGYALLATPILALLLTAWAYALGEARARARPATVAAPPPERAPEPVPETEPAAAPLAAKQMPDAMPPPAAPARAPAVFFPPLVSPSKTPPPPATKPAPKPAPVSTPAPAPPSDRRIPVTEALPVPPLPELPRPPFPKAPPSAAAVEKSLAEAEAAGKTEAIPELKVALGLARFREGANSAQAANDVRGGLIMAMQAGQKLAQARARVALGDLCKAGDDLTTACEHWQIARDLFHKEQKPDERKEAEARIRANGCPTDWVLNEF